MIKPNFIGYDNKPFSIVHWLVDGVAIFKTVCYSVAEETEAIKNYNNGTSGFCELANDCDIERV